MAKKSSKHTKKIHKHNKKHYNKSFSKGAFIIVLIFVIFVFTRFKHNVKDIKYENTQLVLNNSNITQSLQNGIVSNNNDIYMSIEDIKNYLDSTLYIEDETGTIITKGNKKLAAIKKDDKSILINGSIRSAKNIVMDSNGKTYLAISQLEDVYDYKFTYIQKSNVCVIESLTKKSIKAYAKKNIDLKKESKSSSETIEVVPKGSWVIYIGRENDMAKIRTNNGNIGYTKEKNLDNYVVERDDFDNNQEKNVEESSFEYDITKKDIKSFEKRLKIINLVLQQAIKNDKMYIKIINNGEKGFEFERFKIEIEPMLKECGITVEF